MKMGEPTDVAATAAPAPKRSARVEMTEEDEEAIRAKLREAGWDKKKLAEKKKKKETEDADTSGTAHDAPKRSGREDKDKEKEKETNDAKEDRDRRGGRGSRRSRSPRRRSERGSRRRRSRSPSASEDRDRGRARSRQGDRGSRRSRSASASPSRSRSASKPRSKRSRRDDETKTNTDGKESGSNDANKKPANDANADDKKKRESDRSKSSRHRHRSRSVASRSPSRSSRHRRRRRSRSRSWSASAPRSRRSGGRRGSSRSRSRSRRRHRSSRRRSRSASRSRSRSYSRRRRSKSRTRRDANSSPEPHQHPPITNTNTNANVPATIATATISAANSLNPTITQLMAQHPTMSLQEIIAKMQATNVTLAAAASMKPARELYVGNLPASITGQQLQDFLGTIIQQVGLNAQPGNPILSTWISTDGHFAFCEMRSVDECNLALMLNQLPLLGQPLKFGRPKSFVGPPQPIPVLPPRTQTALANLGCTPNPVWFASMPMPPAPATDGMALGPTAGIAPFYAVAATPVLAVASSHLLRMANVPVVLAEDQVKELVQPFGELKSFELVKDPATGQPTGSALFEYVDTSVTEEAMKGLDGLDLGGPPLEVRRAASVSSDETGPVLRMANMVAVEELNDDEEYADLKEDVEEECKRFGTVVTLEIPRPKDGQAVPGVGDIFVQFETTEQAAAALKALSGRKFGGKIVKVSYFPLAKLEQKNFA